MKKVKKFLSILMALIMMLSLIGAIQVFGAADAPLTGKYPTVNGIKEEDGVTVKAYQIFQLNAAKNAYELVPVLQNNTNYPITIEDGKIKPTAYQINKIAANLSTLGLSSVTFFKAADGTYTYPDPAGSSTNYLDFGTWIIIIEGSGKYLYNPSILSVTYKPDGTGYGQLNLADDVLWDPATYAKVSEPTITKTTAATNTYVQKGEPIQFTLTVDIPQYTDYRLEQAITLKITDTLAGGFTLINNDAHLPSVSIDGQTQTADTDLNTAVNTAITTGSTSFTVDLSSYKNTIIKDNRGKKLAIQYWAQATALENTAVNKLTNTASYEYSINEGTQTKQAETIHYTFGMDNSLNKDSNITTAEFIKTDESENGRVTYDSSTGTLTPTNCSLLQGAKFEVRIGTAEGPVFTTCTTNDKGRLSITGLDSDVTYCLVETESPKGYSINALKVKLVITPYNTPTFTGYTITLSDDKGSSTSVNYKYTDNNISFDNTETILTPYIFKNTKLGNLPSTGGIGTTIFTIGGCLLMIVAAALFFISRRKDPK